MTSRTVIMNYTYTKDTASLTSFVKTMLWISIAIGVILLVSDLLQMRLLSSNFTQAEAEANDSRQTIVGLFFSIIFIITGISFFKWTYRANLNCRGFGASNMNFTPG